ncbi:NAD-dependent epimerase/dehydratase family protein [Herbiconiux ginsengi]|uniref:Nucleoside-diphosphate-sugar epimerase n=1 Tax=Herbiconiux ginsengi TaxID=381665 RepID=A0A1H3LIQ9_9MICO|nr:NAD(P)-dependent oxidoreductase [Herbiconiux ginsengi]SDY63848.1 Nucleoside-diphosphate-sugar epimerase [Herbiconiux ginsengi]
MTWLVTGSEGKLGRELVAGLDERGIAVRTMDVVPSSREGHVEGDVREPAVRAHAVSGVDVIIHLGGLASDSAGTPSEILEVNAGGTVALADAAVVAGCRRFVYASSINAVGIVGPGSPTRLPVGDDEPARPSTPYQVSKLLAEDYLLYLHRAGAISSVILRPTYVATASDYAAWQSRDFAALPRTRSELYSYIDIRDCVEALIHAARAVDVPPGPYYLSAADTDAFQPSLEIVSDWPVPRRPDFIAYFSADPHRALIDTTSTSELLGWTPTRTWRATDQTQGNDQERSQR